MMDWVVMSRPDDHRIDNEISAFGAEQEPPGPAMVSVESLDERQASELLRDPSVLAGPDLPVALIEPLNYDAIGFEAEMAGRGWAMAAIGADATTKTGAGVVVAVLDTGVDDAHEAFAGVTVEHCDFTGTGEADRHGHGTHCAGTAIGRDIGGERIGVARGVERLLSGKVLDDHGRGSTAWIADGIVWAVRRGADVISMSIGIDFSGLVARLVDKGMPERAAISQALELYRHSLRFYDGLASFAGASRAVGRQPVLVAATGNDSARTAVKPYRIAAGFPAAAAGVVSVAALGPAPGAMLDVARFSNTQPVVAAPGLGIRSAALGGGLVAKSGTSMACPHVAGIAALWWEAVRGDRFNGGSDQVIANIRAMARSNRLVAGVLLEDVGSGVAWAPD